MKRLSEVFTVLMLAVLLWAAAAQANGTLTATFIYNGGGSNQPLANAYVYLQNGSTTPRGQYYQKAQYMLGPTNGSGYLSVSVPNGTYYMRFMRRAPLSSTPTSAQLIGQPRPGDYTAGGPSSFITVTTGSVINLGTVYANVAGSSLFGVPITISGKVTAGGVPQAGYFVYATKTQCSFGWQNGCQGGAYSWVDYYTPVITNWCQSSVFPSGCTGVKYPAQSRTDSNGNYKINVTSPGTYYVFAQPNPRSRSNYCEYCQYNTYFNSTATAWDPAPSCAGVICGGQYYATSPNNFSPSQGNSPLCYSDCPVTVTGAGATVNISW